MIRGSQGPAWEMAESTSRLLQTPDLLDGAEDRVGWPTPFELTYSVRVWVCMCTVAFVQVT